MNYIGNFSFYKREESTIERLFKAFEEAKANRKSDHYEVSYIEIREDCRSRGFAYILLHHAIYTTLQNASLGSSVNLLDQSSNSKASNLYRNVGNYRSVSSKSKKDFEYSTSFFGKEFHYYLLKFNKNLS